MKNLKILIILFGVLLMASCSKEENLSMDESDLDLQLPMDAGGLEFGNVILPAGTRTKISNDRSSVQFELPEGIVYVGIIDNELVQYSLGCYECTSSCTKGCNVVSAGGGVGCSACETGFITKCTGDSCDGSFDINGGGFIDLNRGIVLADKDSYVPLSQPNWETLIKHPIAKAGIEEFVNDLWGGMDQIDPDNSQLVPFDVYGTVINVYTPLTYSSRVEAVAETTCSCTSGSSGCDYKKKIIGEYCDSGECNTCRMEW
ncbi:hypothetical protein [Ekhidna sp.]